MIVIPMAGASQRFFDAGFMVPKYQLLLNGCTVFSCVVESFRRYFDSDTFLFIVREVHDTPAFVEQQLSAVGVADYRILVLPTETAGQADTVQRALPEVTDDEPLYIFNIDTIRRDFQKPDWVAEVDGYLEVFRGDGEHWSFVLEGAANQVLRTTEKERISDLCSNGLYYFRNKRLFSACYEEVVRQVSMAENERYIAPLYNYMIGRGLDVRYALIERDQLDFCGTPQEYRQLCQRLPKPGGR